MDPLMVRQLKQLFLTSNKAVAVYTNDRGSLHYLPVWPDEQAPASHPKHGDHRLAGFIDWATGLVVAAPAVAGRDEAPTGQRGLLRAPWWARGAALLWTLVKMLVVVWFGLAIIILLFLKVVISAAVGNSGGGGWGRR